MTVTDPKSLTNAELRAALVAAARASMAAGGALTSETRALVVEVRRRGVLNLPDFLDIVFEAATGQSILNLLKG